MPNSVSINSSPTTTNVLLNPPLRSPSYSEVELIRTPPARSFTPTPPVSRSLSANGSPTASTPGRLHGESDLSLLLRTLDFAARVSAFRFIDRIGANGQYRRNILAKEEKMSINPHSE